MESNYTLHLAMAALVGASFVAVSAYYMHRKTLTQLLEFAKTVERERERELAGGDDDDDDKERSKNQRSRRKGSGYYRRGSNSLPDVTAAAIVDHEERRNGVDDREFLIPADLPALHTLHGGGGQSGGRASSTKRSGHIIGPPSPKSPAVSASAFESVEGSDEDDNMTDNSKLDSDYLQANGNGGTVTG